MSPAPSHGVLATASTLDHVTDRLESIFDDAIRRSMRHSPAYRDLWIAMRDSTRGGKRRRPLLAIAAYGHLGGTDREAAIDFATAIELLHTALLLHDDVIDGDVERRGRPNIIGGFAASARDRGIPDRPAQRWGETAAILAGDLLLVAASRLVATLDIDVTRRRALLDLFDESVSHSAAGELADVAYATGLGTPTAVEIARMMAEKTAYYSLELPLRGAALLAGRPEAVTALGEIGRSLGVLFQLRDDLLGVFGVEAETGKTTTGDLREGKQTLLIAFARDSAEWQSAAHLFGDPELDDVGAATLRDALESSGARERVEGELRRLQQATLALIDTARLPDDLVALLTQEAVFAAERRA